MHCLLWAQFHWRWEKAVYKNAFCIHCHSLFGSPKRFARWQSCVLMYSVSHAQLLSNAFTCKRNLSTFLGIPVALKALCLLSMAQLPLVSKRTVKCCWAWVQLGTKCHFLILLFIGVHGNYTDIPLWMSTDACVALVESLCLCLRKEKKWCSHRWETEPGWSQPQPGAAMGAWHCETGHHWGEGWHSQETQTERLAAGLVWLSSLKLAKAISTKPVCVQSALNWVLEHHTLLVACVEFRKPGLLELAARMQASGVGCGEWWDTCLLHLTHGATLGQPQHPVPPGTDHASCVQCQQSWRMVQEMCAPSFPDFCWPAVDIAVVHQHPFMHNSGAPDLWRHSTLCTVCCM